MFDSDVERCFLRLTIDWDGRISRAEAVRCSAPPSAVAKLAEDLVATVESWRATAPPWTYTIPLFVPLSPEASVNGR